MPTLRIANVNEGLMHYLTLTVIEWIDIFTKPEYFQIITDSLEYCRKHKGLKLYEFVIMTNYMHLIAAAAEGHELSGIIRDFKRHTTKMILKQLGSDNRKYITNLLKNSFSRKPGNENQIWQKENYAVVISSEEFYFEKAGYIHKNPVRKEYVENPEDWKYSSAGKKAF